MSQTDKRDEFVSCYLKSRNGVEAMRRAGYSPPFDPYRLLRDPYVKSRIREAHEHLAMEGALAVANLGEIARGEWGAYLQANGTVDLESLTADGKSHLVAKVKVSRDGTTTVDFPDRLKALEIILRMEGLLGTNIGPEDLIAFMVRFGGTDAQVEKLKAEANAAQQLRGPLEVKMTSEE